MLEFLTEADSVKKAYTNAVTLSSDALHGAYNFVAVLLARIRLDQIQ